jgi:acetamidase/formamidase
MRDRLARNFLAQERRQGIVDWLVGDQQLSSHEAYALCGVAGDLKISETVDVPTGWYP